MLATRIAPRSPAVRLVPFAPIVPFVLLAAAPAALAQDLPDPTPLPIACDGEYRSSVHVDGLQRDWEDEAGPVDRIQQLVAGEYRYDWTGPSDASFKVWCRYNQHGLYFAIVGRDNAIIGPEGSRGGDRLEFWFTTDDVAEDPDVLAFQVPLWPVHDEGWTTPTWLEGGDGELRASRAEIARRENGFFVEMEVPFLAVPDLDPLFGPLHLAIVQRDRDDDTTQEQEVGISTAGGDPARDGLSVLGAFTFDEISRRAGSIADRNGGSLHIEPVLGELGGRPGADMALVAGDQLFVAGPGFEDFDWTAVTVRFHDDHVPMSIELHDVDHDGDAEIFYRFRRERQNLDGVEIHQEFLQVWRLDGEQLTRLVNQEIAVERPGAWRVENELVLRPRTHHSVVRIMRPDDIEGLDRDTFVDIEDDDAPGYERALLPWSGRSRLNWEPSGDGWAVIDE